MVRWGRVICGKNFFEKWGEELWMAPCGERLIWGEDILRMGGGVSDSMKNDNFIYKL